MMDTRPGKPLILHSVDIFVDANGIIYTTDLNAGFYIMEYTG